MTLHHFLALILGSYLFSLFDFCSLHRDYWTSVWNMRFTLSKKNCDNFSEGKFTAFLFIDAYINIMITSTNYNLWNNSLMMMTGDSVMIFNILHLWNILWILWGQNYHAHNIPLNRIETALISSLTVICR